MRTMRSATAMLGTVLLLLAVPTHATDETPTYTESGRGRAAVFTGTLASFSMQPGTGETFDLPDVPANDPTVEGGSVYFYEIDNTGNGVIFQLPAAGWRRIGTDPLNPKGFRYKGAGVPGDPCVLVRVKRRGVKAICRGSDVTLSPPLSTFFLGVTLTVGANSKMYCPAYYALVNAAGVVRGTPALVEHSQVCATGP